jgi:hypothetical protein
MKPKSKSPLAGRPSPFRGKRLPAETLTPAEVAALLAACSRRGSAGCRNRALIALLYRSGLRIAEALGLRPCDLNMETGAINVRFAKGGDSRVAAADAHACEIVGVWLERRARLGIGAAAPIFCTLRGTPMQPAYFRTALARLGRKAQIVKRSHAHALRHSYASELAAEGVELRAIAALLGHKSTATPDRARAKIAPTAAIAVVRQRPAWANGSAPAPTPPDAPTSTASKPAKVPAPASTTPPAAPAPRPTPPPAPRSPRPPAVTTPAGRRKKPMTPAELIRWEEAHLARMRRRRERERRLGGR